MHAERLGQPHQLSGPFVGRVDLPPELETQQALVEPAGALPIRHA